MDCEVADFEDLVLVAGATEDQPISFIRMKVTRADQKMTQIAARNCSHSWCADPVYIRPLTPKGTQVPLRRQYVAWVVATTCPAAFR